MRSTIKQKIISLVLIVASVVLHFFLFDRGVLALIAPIILVAGIIISFLVIKHSRGWLIAMIPIIIWALAVIVNRVSGSYEYYSKYDFIDPLEGAFVSGLLAFCAICLTIYYFLRNPHHPKL